jgi:hypothetical protein
MRGISVDKLGRKAEKARLSRMVQKELENMTVNKHMYDAEHPDNAKCIPREQMMRIARNKIMQELASPPTPADQAEWEAG